MSAELPESLAARYRFVRELGRGGFGRVVLVQDRKLERPVALKLLALDASDQEVRTRFEREARVTAGLAHPGVVEVYDHGVAAEGQPFIAYAYVEGESLPTSGGAPAAQVRHWGRELATALQAVHAAGLVHRDVKPANVLLAGGTRPVLCDLGLVRAVHPHARTMRTAEGVILGTPPYMAPELWRGSEATPASDQWAWAATLLRAWSGRGAYSGEDPGEILKELPGWRPDLGDPREEAPELGQVLTRALDPDPAGRYPSMDEAAAALSGSPRPPRAAPTVALVDPPGGVRAAETVTVPRTRPRRSGRWSRAALATVGLALVGVGAWWAGGAEPSPRTAPPASPTPPPAGEVALEERPEFRRFREAMRALKEETGAPLDSADADWPFALRVPEVPKEAWALLGRPAFLRKVRQVLEAADALLGAASGDATDERDVVLRLYDVGSLFEELDRGTNLKRAGSRLIFALGSLRDAGRLRSDAWEQWLAIRGGTGEAGPIRGVLERFLEGQARALEADPRPKRFPGRLVAAMRLARAAGSPKLPVWVDRMIRVGGSGAALLFPGGEDLHEVTRALETDHVGGDLDCPARRARVSRFQRWAWAARDQVLPGRRVELWLRCLRLERGLDHLCQAVDRQPGRRERLLDLARWGEQELARVPPQLGQGVEEALSRLERSLGESWDPTGPEDESTWARVRQRLSRAVAHQIRRIRMRDGVTDETAQRARVAAREAVGKLREVAGGRDGVRAGLWHMMRPLAGRAAWEVLVDPRLPGRLGRALRRLEGWADLVAERSHEEQDEVILRLRGVRQLIDHLGRSLKLLDRPLQVVGGLVDGDGAHGLFYRARASWLEIATDLGASQEERTRAFPAEPGALRRAFGFELAEVLEHESLGRWVRWTLDGVGGPPVDEHRELGVLLAALGSPGLLDAWGCEDRLAVLPEVFTRFRDASPGLEALQKFDRSMLWLRLEHDLAPICGVDGVLPGARERVAAAQEMFEQGLAGSPRNRAAHFASRLGGLQAKYREWSGLRSLDPELGRSVVDQLAAALARVTGRDG